MSVLPFYIELKWETKYESLYFVEFPLNRVILYVSKESLERNICL